MRLREYEELIDKKNLDLDLKDKQLESMQQAMNEERERHGEEIKLANKERDMEKDDLAYVRSTLENRIARLECDLTAYNEMEEQNQMMSNKVNVFSFGAERACASVCGTSLRFGVLHSRATLTLPTHSYTGDRVDESNGRPKLQKCRVYESYQVRIVQCSHHARAKISKGTYPLSYDSISPPHCLTPVVSSSPSLPDIALHLFFSCVLCLSMQELEEMDARYKEEAFQDINKESKRALIDNSRLEEELALQSVGITKLLKK